MRTWDISRMEAFYYSFFSFGAGSLNLERQDSNPSHTFAFLQVTIKQFFILADLSFQSWPRFLSCNCVGIWTLAFLLCLKSFFSIHRRVGRGSRTSDCIARFSELASYSSRSAYGEIVMDCESQGARDQFFFAPMRSLFSASSTSSTTTMTTPATTKTSTCYDNNN